MPLAVPSGLPSIFVRRDSFERSGLTRPEIDNRFNLTDAEFRVEGNLIVIGPLPSEDMIAGMVEHLEARGLAYFDEFFELSGNWPEWLQLYAR